MSRPLRSLLLPKILIFVILLASILIYNITTQNGYLKTLRGVLVEDDLLLSGGGDNKSGGAVTSSSYNNDFNEPLPSWAVVTQCSLYHTDCPNHMKFHDYPFPLKGSNELFSATDQFDWIEDTAAPTTSNNVNSTNNNSINDLVGYEFPPKADEQSKQECLIYTQTHSIEDQLDHILNHHLTPLKDTHTT